MQTDGWCMRARQRQSLLREAELKFAQDEQNKVQKAADASEGGKEKAGKGKEERGKNARRKQGRLLVHLGEHRSHHPLSLGRLFFQGRELLLPLKSEASASTRVQTQHLGVHICSINQGANTAK